MAYYKFFVVLYCIYTVNHKKRATLFLTIIVAFLEWLLIFLC